MDSDSVVGREKYSDWTVIGSYVKNEDYLLLSKKSQSTSSSVPKKFRSENPSYSCDRL